MWPATSTQKNENFTHFQALILLFGAAIAYECYECKYDGKDPENLCLRPSEDSGKVSIKSVKSEEDHLSFAQRFLYLI